MNINKSIIKDLELEKLDYFHYYENEMLKNGLDLGFSHLNFEPIRDRKPFSSVDPTCLDSFPPEARDLVRLHYLIRKTKAISPLEIGMGESTKVILHALELNDIAYRNDIEGVLRREEPFNLNSIETSQFWLNNVLSKLNEKNKKRLNATFSNCYHGTFNDRMCTYFESMPNVSPDFIYLDGPDQFNVSLNIDNQSTRHSERMPMIGDLLRIEHFLVPGCVILVDGRTANVRFMKANFQCNWEYEHFVEEDIHIFIKVDSPLGEYNLRELNFKNMKIQ